jgi:hypothetical protein
VVHRAGAVEEEGDLEVLAGAVAGGFGLAKRYTSAKEKGQRQKEKGG